MQDAFFPERETSKFFPGRETSKFFTMLSLPRARSLSGEPDEALRLMAVLVRNTARNLRRRPHRSRQHSSWDQIDLEAQVPHTDVLLIEAEEHVALLGCIPDNSRACSGAWLRCACWKSARRRRPRAHSLYVQITSPRCSTAPSGACSPAWKERHNPNSPKRSVTRS